MKSTVRAKPGKVCVEFFFFFHISWPKKRYKPPFVGKHSISMSLSECIFVNSISMRSVVSAKPYDPGILMVVESC